MPFFKSFNRKILGFFNVLSLRAISVKKIYKHRKDGFQSEHEFCLSINTLHKYCLSLRRLKQFWIDRTA